MKGFSILDFNIGFYGSKSSPGHLRMPGDCQFHTNKQKKHGARLARLGGSLEHCGRFRLDFLRGAGNLEDL